MVKDTALPITMGLTTAGRPSYMQTEECDWWSTDDNSLNLLTSLSSYTLSQGYQGPSQVNTDDLQTGLLNPPSLNSYLYPSTELQLRYMDWRAGLLQFPFCTANQSSTAAVKSLLNSKRYSRLAVYFQFMNLQYRIMSRWKVTMHFKIHQLPSLHYYEVAVCICENKIEFHPARNPMTSAVPTRRNSSAYTRIRFA